MATMLLSRFTFRARYKDYIVPVCALFSVAILVILHVRILAETRRCLPSQYQMLEKSERIRRLPQVIIIGARKSGTRALLKFLELNPSVKAAKSEVHFFDKLQNYKKGLEWYRSKMPETLEHELTVEKSPAYFVTREVPERIKAMNSSIKLILILRDPVIRLISDFSQIIANKMERTNETITSHEYEDESYYYDVQLSPSAPPSSNETTDAAWNEAVQKFEDFVMRPDGGIDEQRSAVRIGMYSLHLERWLAHFPRANLHIVDGETLISKPYGELNKLELFLNLKPVIRPDDFVFNHRKGFFCVAKDRNSSSSSTAAGNTNRARRMASDPKLTGAICLSRSKGRRHVFVKQELIEALKNFYDPYNKYLQSLMGIDFDWVNKET